MFKSEIIVTDSLGNGISLDLNDELSTSFNFNIADVKDPSGRNGSYSKTINVFGTKKNNKFFEYIYEINIATKKFNANLRTPCIVIADGVQVLSGHLKLKNIQLTEKNKAETIIYQIEIYGENLTLFTEIGEKKLEDLDFSKYNHILDYTKVFQTWNNFNDVSGIVTPIATAGQGYRYMLANYGYNNFVYTSFKIDWLRPGLHIKEYWDAIFAAAGKTYTSSFLTDVNKRFCKQFMPNNSENVTLTAAAKASYECSIGDTGLQVAIVHPLQYGGIVNDWNNYSNWTVPILEPKWNTEFADPGNVYNPITGIFTVAAQGNYVLSSNFNFETKFDYPATATSNSPSGGSYIINLEKSTDGGLTWAIINAGSYTDFVPVTGVYSTHVFNISFPSMYLNIGEKYKMTMRWVNSPFWSVIFYDAGLSPVITGTASISTRLTSAATFKVSLVDTKIIEGQPIDMNSLIPRDIKQKDFIMSEIRKFNLYVMEDKTKPNNYIIEPRDDFSALGKVIDWTEKWAIDRVMDARPMGEIDIKEFNWTYKSDNDYYNKDYFDNYVEVYGAHKQIVNNDFLNKVNKTEVIFSPTQIVDNTTNELIIPHILAYDGTTVKPTKHNVRCLLWNGLKTISTYYVIDSSTGGLIPVNVYPNVGMVDDPLLPTESIEFGVPSKVYYNTSFYTANNLFNGFYSKYINEITDRDSMVVTMYLDLNAIDIASFRFYDTVFIKDTFYIVNKIIDYNPLSDGLTKVELLKLKRYSNWVPQEISDLDSLITNSGETLSLAPYGESSSSNRIGQANNQMAGQNISSKSVGAMLSGTNINVSTYCTRINIISCENVTVAEAVSGFNAMNCSGIEMGASGFNNSITNCSNLRFEPGVSGYMGFDIHEKVITVQDSYKIEYGKATGKTVTTLTTDTTIDNSFDTYLIDASGGPITLTLKDRGTVYNIKKIDGSANVVTVISDNPAAINVEGLPSYDLTTQYESKSFQLDDTKSNWYII